MEKIHALLRLYREGKLGGERMPEDENPGLPIGSKENYLYFTLPMALNYQRNSYTLWRSAHLTWKDPETRDVFDPAAVTRMTDEVLREKLTRYKVALQPNKQPEIWRRLCKTIVEKLDGDLRNLFLQNSCSIKAIKEDIAAHKKDYPYLGGKKILNYWLFVMERYTDLSYPDRDAITIAPDTHVIQASVRLGIITAKEATQHNVQDLTVNRWKEKLEGSGLLPIDLHTPLWLWSRGKFSVDLTTEGKDEEDAL